MGEQVHICMHMGFGADVRRLRPLRAQPLRQKGSLTKKLRFSATRGTYAAPGAVLRPQNGDGTYN